MYEWCNADVMYDVVSIVLKLQGTIRDGDRKTDANYIRVHRELNKICRVSIMDVIRYLRLAEEKGYVKGHSGFWNHHGQGGAKKWHFVKWPPYPYYELMEGNNGE